MKNPTTSLEIGIGILLKTFLLIALLTSPSAYAAAPRAIGDPAPNFTLKTLADKTVELQKLTSKTKVVLIVLRGWPGYQCPICERQVGDMIQHAAQIKQRNVQMLFVYPGPAEELKAHAQEFLQNKEWPKEFLFVTDPDYTFTTTYGLRWDAPKETAYPSTFIIDTDNKVRFARVSKTHGGRVSASELLKSIDELK
jgi:peroxiredoxin